MDAVKNLNTPLDMASQSHLKEVPVVASKRTRACEFNQKAREEIDARDRGCIFCRQGYMMAGAFPGDLTIFETMHYIPRSRGGLGIAKNGAIGCKWHHMMLDNGNKGNHEEMLNIFADYLRGNYRDWNEKDLVYSKW